MISLLSRLRVPNFLIFASIFAATVVSINPPAVAQLPGLAHGPVDLVVVYKRDRLLHLKSKGRIVRSFDIALGAEPVGHKLVEGDNRTPEGVYTLDWRNANSQFHRSMHISYPHEDDEEAAQRRGVSPGGLVMIHGLPNGRKASDMNHPVNDWTNGCVAVTNAEMDEIWSLVEDGTTIIIFP
ncbi:MAG: L,D-transpeptidase family protein [Pseudomonadota bacterium]